MLDAGRLKASDELYVKPQADGFFVWELGRWMSEADLYRYAESEGLTVVICHGEGDPRTWQAENVIAIETHDE